MFLELVANPLLPGLWDIVWGAVLVVLAALAAVAFVSVVRARNVVGLRALLWFAVIVLLPVIGSVIWFASADRRAAAEGRRTS